MDIASNFIPRKAMTISVWVYGRSNGGLGNGRILDNGALVLKIPMPNAWRFQATAEVLKRVLSMDHLISMSGLMWW